MYSRLKADYSPRNVVECNLNAGRRTASPGKSGPVTPAGFDVILASAAEPAETHSLCIHFAYTRLLLAMQNIALGGAFVLALDSRPLGYVVDIITILHQTFASITALPSQTSRDMVYIACRGYGGSEGLRSAQVLRIHEVLRELGGSGQHLSTRWARR